MNGAVPNPGGDERAAAGQGAAPGAGQPPGLDGAGAAAGAHAPLRGPGVSVEIPVAWGEMDALGHVNNAVYFRYFECARVEFLRRLGWSDRTTNASGPGFILHSVSARFRRPVRYPDTLTVRAFVTEVGTDRLTIGHTIHSAAQGGALVAEGSGVVVCYDYAAGCKVGLPGGFVAALGR